MSEDTRDWSLWRQDDNGNCVCIRDGLTRPEAEALSQMYEERGHKQMYWAEQHTAEAPVEDRDPHFAKLERMYADAPINRFFRPELHVEEGRATVRLPVDERLHHTAGAMHGSAYFKALDDAAFFAANSIVPGSFVLTATFEVSLLRPVVSGEIVAVGVVTSEDERRVNAEAELRDAQGELVATGKGTFARSSIPLTPKVGYR